MPRMFSGTCACGRISVSCNEMPSRTTACHCVQCRKISGGPYQLYTDVSPESLTFLDNTTKQEIKGKLPLEWKDKALSFTNLSKAGERVFCIDCKSLIWMRYLSHEEFVGISVALIDESSVANEKVKEKLGVMKHMFGSQKAFWDHTSFKDGKEVVQRFSEGWEESISSWEKN
ncbi:hypothetical protein K470DRAFT_255440 [Piedraia hortae CBS 480.64]|uniref:CENP-V/GFA domain-containing protein n=1 Tax=Piedraia hortae CBS 480.64 TaxID=1314780 RepID=A0A6A7C8C1_9PEZI|nr:hypothetical protein K470DRAFT_255440 [Piedraia hortae CBS 480.64]